MPEHVYATYNVFIRIPHDSYNFTELSIDQVQKIVSAYLRGDATITLSGKKKHLSGLLELAIFGYSVDRPLKEEIEFYSKNYNFFKKGPTGHYLPPETLAMMGPNVTKDFIGDSEYGQAAIHESEHIQVEKIFISKSRIEELKQITSNKFDLKRLIKLCEETNDNFSNSNFGAVAMIARTIINHVPPIFGYDTFDQVVANYGGAKDNKSFKKNMYHLSNSLKHIADSQLHQTIRKSESLPNETQVDFRQDFDVLLGEIARLLK
jgi:hypothetical protein